MAKKTKKQGKKFAYRHIVKRKGHNEKFDERKVYASVYEACHADYLKTATAERIAAAVTTQIKKWMEKQDAVSANKLHDQVVHELKKHHTDVAFLYDTHKDIS